MFSFFGSHSFYLSKHIPFINFILFIFYYLTPSKTSTAWEKKLKTLSYRKIMIRQYIIDEC